MTAPRAEDRAVADEILSAAATLAGWLPDLQAFRGARRLRPRRPYDALMPGQDHLSSRLTCDRIIGEGWRYAGLPPVLLRPPVDWENACSSNRSWSFHLHSLDALGPLLRRHDETGDHDLLVFAARLVLDWVRSHCEPDTGSPFAWYDMAVGVRSYRLAYVVDLVARGDEWSDDDVATLLASVRLHMLRLADDAEFAGRNNHGFFQVAGQLAMSARLPELPGMPETRRQADRRLREMIDTHFTSEGVHREHSPGYHLAVTSTFETLIRAGLVSDDHRATAEVLEDRFAWFVLPDGSMAELGDTEPTLRPPAALPELASAHLRYVLTGGEAGELPPERLRAFPESGYVVFRSPPADPLKPYHNSSYLVQTCAFHSRTHKHADDLSFIWYDRGVELLTDAGRYGYLQKLERGHELYEQGFWYGDPKRIYVESTCAHTTVEIDGRPHERKGVAPFGSALRRWGQVDDKLLYAESSVVHRRTIEHVRMLVFSPGEWLIVFDALADRARGGHDYVQRFLFGPALTCISEQPVLTLGAPGRAWSLHVVPLLPAELVGAVHGEDEPLLGWISRRPATLEPVWTAGYAARGVARHVFATLLALGDEAPIVGRCRANVTGRRAQLAWTADGVEHRVEIERGGAEIALGYAIQGR